MLLEIKNLTMLSDEFPKSPASEWNGLVQTMDSFSQQEGYIHKDQTEEMTMLYFTMFKNELSRYWEDSNQGRMARSMDQLMELFFYCLVGQGRK